MRRIRFAFDYRPYWQAILSPHDEALVVREAVACLKRDEEAFALLVGVGAEPPGQDVCALLDDTLVEHVAVVERDDGRGPLVLLRGPAPFGGEGSPSAAARRSAGVIIESLRFVAVDRLAVTLLVASERTERVVAFLDGLGVPYEVLAIEGVRADTVDVDGLAPRQREAVTAAYELGYYDVPRAASSREVADRLGIDRSTLLEHLRKAEGRLVGRAVRGAAPPTRP